MTLSRPISALGVALSIVASAHAQSSIRNYGSGTPGTGGLTPSAWVSTTPHNGDSNFAITIENGLPSAAATAFLALAPSSVSLFGLDFLVDLASPIGLGNIALSGAGDGAFPIPLPTMPVLIGRPLYAQAFAVDPGSSAQIAITATEGLEFSIRLGPPTLLASHAARSSGDNQTAIDLRTGSAMNFGAAFVDNAREITFSVDGSIACYTTTVGDSVEVFDVRGLPPVHLQSIDASGAPGAPAVIAASPDGLLLYVGSAESVGTGDQLEVLFGIPFDPTFGQPFGVPSLPIGRTASELVFKPDGTRVYLAMLGIGETALVLEIDADTSSPSFHTVLNRGRFGSTVWSVAANDDFVYVASGPLLGPASIHVLDAATFREIDFDPATPGTQPLGGEVSVPRTDVASKTNRIAIGPRGRFLYTANRDSVSRINVDASSPNVRNVLTVPAGTGVGAFELVVSDAGDLLYVSHSTTDEIVEYETATMTELRRWSVAPNPRDLSYR